MPGEYHIPPELKQELATNSNGSGNGAYKSVSVRQELRSSEANEMLERPPAWLMRWGIFSTIMVFMLLFGIATLVKYPDTLEGNAIITTNPFPIHLKALTGGRIAKLFAIDGQQLKKGNVIAEFENNMGYDQLAVIRAIADSAEIYLQQGNKTGLSDLLSHPVYSLGEAQPFYNALLQNISSYLLIKNEDIYTKRAENVQKQIQRFQSVSNVANKETKLIDEELTQYIERFTANEKLYQDKVISRMEYFDEAAKLRQRKLALESQRKASLQSNIAIADNSKQLLEIRYDRAERERSLHIAIGEAVRNLKNYIQGWEKQYLIIAPYDGVVHYLRFVQQNEVVGPGEQLFALTPSNYHYIAYVNLPSAGLGKVQPGQKVHLLLSKFPYQEYGYLEGKVISLSELPIQQAEKDDKGPVYKALLQLPDTLITSYHKSIPFSPEMPAIARIITNDRSLLQRMIDGISGWKK